MWYPCLFNCCSPLWAHSSCTSSNLPFTHTLDWTNMTGVVEPKPFVSAPGPIFHLFVSCFSYILYRTCEMACFSENYVFLSLHIIFISIFHWYSAFLVINIRSIKFLCLTGVGAETPLRLRLRSKVSAPCGSGSTALSLIVLVMRNAHSYLHTSYSRDLYLGPPTYLHSLPPLENYI
jgi:hypothetical protein